MTRLLILAGLVCLGLFVWCWQPAGFLLAGLVLLGLAAVRTVNGSSTATTTRAKGGGRR